jgi:hypothetical protein
MAGFIEMAVTPNYSWPVPVATDLVKDGYQAIADLGDAIDATVYGQSSALVLVKSQVIGSAVASVAVTGAFSTTYDAYKIVIANTVPSASTVINMILGSTATGYYYTTVASTFSTGAYTAQLGAANTTLFTAVGNSNTANVSNSFELISPFLSAKTFFNANYVNVGGAAAGMMTGYLDNTTSYTAFTLSTVTGTLTGGTIYVYGYTK